MSDIVQPALPRACAGCPWRTANQGVPHVGGWYNARNLRRLWGGLRRGERMTCHPTDPRMNDMVGAADDEVREDATTHECTGSLVLVQRELMVLQKAFGSDPARYARERRGGLTKAGMVEAVSRYFFGGSPRGGMAMSRPDLGDTEVDYGPLADWKQLWNIRSPSA